METRMEGSMAPSGEEAKNAGREMAEGAKDAASKLTAALSAARSKVEERTVAGARVTDRTIREHPYESIGIAFGIGVVIGLLINRK